MFSEVAKVYDPLGLVAPVTLVGKILYREMCEAKVPWDGELTETMKQRWKEWGGQFERLIGLFKRAFYKCIGKSVLTFEELEDVVLDVEVTLNNRPLSYLEDDVEQPVLTPNAMLNVNPVEDIISNPVD